MLISWPLDDVSWSQHLNDDFAAFVRNYGCVIQEQQFPEEHSF